LKPLPSRVGPVLPSGTAIPNIQRLFPTEQRRRRFSDSVSLPAGLPTGASEVFMLTTSMRALVAVFLISLVIAGALASAKAIKGLESGSENAGWLIGP
jgi:hypothetical protein